jgi:hypothetical protein
MWPFPTKPKLPVTVKVIGVDRQKLRLHQFRSDPKLAGAAQAVLTGDFMRVMLDVLENEAPAKVSFSPQATIEQRALHQARIEGYYLCLANLGALAVATDLPENPEPKFEPEEIHSDL